MITECSSIREWSGFSPLYIRGEKKMASAMSRLIEWIHYPFQSRCIRAVVEVARAVFMYVIDAVCAKSSFHLFSEVSSDTIREMIKQEGLIIENPLFPIRKFSLNSCEYFCSDSFFLGSNKAVFALISIENSLFPRIFYRSTSQGTWRVLPYAYKGPSGKLLSYGKGHFESDTQLPIPLICALNREKNASQKNVNVSDFVSTERADFLSKVAVEEWSLLREGAKRSFYNRGFSVPFSPDPTAIMLPKNKEQLPDFSKPIFIQHQEDPVYGAIQAKVFASMDKQLHYLFFEDIRGRAFLAHAEYRKEKITSYGVRKRVPNLLHMDAPLLEYFQQIPKVFLARNEMPFCRYHCNWNYVRQLEIIKLYYSEQGREMPHFA